MKYVLQVHPSSEESEESQKEDDEEAMHSTNFMPYEYNSKRKELHRLSLKLKGEKDQVEKLNNLTSSQLEAIIGGSLSE